MSQDAKVQVVADAMGNTIRQNQNKPDYGYIRLVQKRTTISPTGFISASNLSTLLTGTIEDLEASGLQHTKEIAGKLYVVEQLSPFNEEADEAIQNRDMKRAGANGPILKAADPETGEILPIYRKVFYSSDGSGEDTLIQHVNGDEIVKNSSNKIKESIKANKKQVDLEESIAEVENEVEPEIVAEEIAEDSVESFEL